ncbi:vacuolar fusion protein MON1 [Blastocladiella britannica]|nr:vacuolar fusion protein MON1 [Blastocladiella britannica]
MDPDGMSSTDAANDRAWRREPVHYFVMADSGKPIYVRHGDESDLTSLLSLLQVLVAHFDQASAAGTGSNALRWIRLPPPAGHQLVLHVRRPLILVAAARRRERCESQLRGQLAALHSFLLSQLTQAQLAGLFARRPNLDLRPLLGAAHPQIGALCDSFRVDLRYLIGCVESVPMAARVRRRFGDALAVAAGAATETRSRLLYGMVLAHGQLVTLIRPKSHSLHPSDLLNLLTLVGSNTQFRGMVGSEHWLPMCLPKFNDQGFLYAYVCYVTPDLGIVLMSSDADAFEEMQAARARMHEYMLKNGLILDAKLLEEPLNAAALMDEPNLKHFVYKSDAHVQFIQVGAGDDTPPPATIAAKYGRLHAALHDRESPLKLLWCESDADGESVLGWNSRGCEVYATWTAGVARSTAIRNVNAIVKWVKAREEDLFILDSPTL